ncbi:unnamed protein product [Dimorphilus gyrociliatus]|uniref:Uncharacterized protein n=1 Tax=Dimorphilus gyrociliatus TaxID=2664684 RepID=A0A7I8VD72_9ANNE|nr:unnamed protein product [Dimorphilus gyrociliatus]
MLNLLYNKLLEESNANIFDEDRKDDLQDLICSRIQFDTPKIDSFNYASSIGVSYVIASKYFNLGRYEEAADSICKLFGHVEDHNDQYQLQEGICLTNAKLWLIHCLIKCNDLEEAMEICNSMMEEEEEDDFLGDNFTDGVITDRHIIMTEYYKAIIYFKTKRNAKALKSFDRVIESLIELISSKKSSVEKKELSILFTHEANNLEYILSKSYEFVGYLHYSSGDKELSVNCFRSGCMASSKDSSIGNNYLFLLKETNKLEELIKNSDDSTPQKILEPDI